MYNQHTFLKAELSFTFPHHGWSGLSWMSLFQEREGQQTHTRLSQGHICSDTTLTSWVP